MLAVQRSFVSAGIMTLMSSTSVFSFRSCRRVTEVQLYRRFHSLKVLNTALVGGVTLGVYVLVRGDLRDTEICTLIAIVNISRFAVSMFLVAVVSVSQVLLSFDRLDAYLSSKGIPPRR